MEDRSSFDSKIIELVLRSNSYGINGVFELKGIVLLLYFEENYEKIRELIASNKIDELKLLEPKPTDGFREYLEIMSFKDQHLNEYIITIYDSDELWQNPEIIEVFRLSEK